jgi:hypothetical protein
VEQAGRLALRVDAGTLPGPRADHNEIAEVVDDCSRERLPIQLVLPAFPFKDQNPFRTSCNASHWDIGEAALIVRLHCIALGLDQLHPYDGECLRTVHFIDLRSVMETWIAALQFLSEGSRL